MANSNYLPLLSTCGLLAVEVNPPFSQGWCKHYHELNMAPRSLDGHPWVSLVCLESDGKLST